MNRSWLKRLERVCFFSLLAVLCYGIWVAADLKIAEKTVYKLEVIPAYMELSVGESVQLTVGGRRKDGSTADPEMVEKIVYYWQVSSEEGVITLDKSTGTVTANAPGEGIVFPWKKGSNYGADEICRIVVKE